MTTQTAEEIRKRMSQWFDTAIYDKHNDKWNEDTMELVFIKLDEFNHPLTQRANAWAAAQYRIVVEVAFHFLRRYPDPAAAKQLYRRVNEEFGIAEQLVLKKVGRPEETKLYNFIRTQRNMCIQLLSRQEIGIYT